MSELFKKVLNKDPKKSEVGETPSPQPEIVDKTVEEPKKEEQTSSKSLFGKPSGEKKEIPTPIIGTSIKAEPKAEVKEVISSAGLFSKTPTPSSVPSQTQMATTLDDEGVEVQRKADHNFGAITSLAEEEYDSKDIVMIYGDKGVGKSTFALEFPGNILAISLDRKTMKVKKNATGEPRVIIDGKDRGPQRIRVFDVISYADMSDIKKYGASLVAVYEFTMKLIQDWKVNNPDFPVDWIFIDGAEELARMAEAIMRWRHNLEMEDGVKNRNVWKYRRFVIKQMHSLCLSVAKRGVVYTTFVDYEETIKSGQLVDKKEIPKWLDVIKLETDHVFRVGVEGARYYAFLESGKGIQSQKKYDVTGIDLVHKVVTEFVKQIQG